MTTHPTHHVTCWCNATPEATDTLDVTTLCLVAIDPETPDGLLPLTIDVPVTAPDPDTAVSTATTHLSDIVGFSQIEARTIVDVRHPNQPHSLVG